MNKFYRFLLKLTKPILPSKIINKEDIPDGPAIFVANHFSVLDVCYISYIYDKNIKFLAKKELFDNKIFGKIIKDIGAIPVNRDNPDMTTFLSIMKQIKSGGKVFIFPEGTRNRSGTNKLQKIKGGSAVFAIKYKVPIIPIMFEKKPKIFKKTYLKVGKPVDLSSFYDIKLNDELINKADEILYNEMNKTQKELIEYVNNKKNRKG